MAGSRRRSGMATRPQARIARNLAALQEAPTVQAALAVAYDWLRAAARGNAGELREAAEWLANRAHRLDKEADA